MKIVSWNCGGKFREKFQDIIAVDADIYVIQECENPAECKSIAYREFAHNYLWIGENKNKGLGVFAYFYPGSATFGYSFATKNALLSTKTKVHFLRDAFLAERDAHYVRDADYVCDARLRRVSRTHRITYHSVAASLIT